MRDRRQSMINRDDTFDIDDTPSSAPTLRDADAALYGALSNVDKKRKSVERTRFGSFTITARGLEMGDGAQQKDWEDAGAFIFQVDTALQWLIGDWLVYGSDLQWGTLEEQAERFERDYQTLRDYMTVSRNVSLSLRNYNLSYNHYRAVTGLDDQWKAYALGFAEQHKLSVVNFRKWIKLGMPDDGLPESTATTAAPPAGNSPDIDVIARDLKKYMQRDPATAKPRQLMAARTEIQNRLRELDQIKAELIQRWGIDE